MTFWGGINPVTLKELRQMVRSRLVAVGLIVYLLAQLVGVSIVLMASDSGDRADLYGKALGQSVFHMVYFLLSFLLLLCIPLLVGTRMGLERGKEHLDLQFVTALKPRQFVDGKIASAVVLSLVFASASLPFLVLSYLLRGVDLFRVLLLFGGLLLIAVCIMCVTLFLGAIGVSRTLRVFLLLGVILGLLFLLGAVNIGGAGLLLSGRSVAFGSWKELAGGGVALALVVMGCQLTRVVTVAALSPPHANRALPVRLWLTACWFFLGVAALMAALVMRDAAIIYVWASLSVLGASALLSVAASMPPGYSRRVLAAVSPRAPLRFVQFFFFSGAEAGMAWALALGFCTVFAVLLMALVAPGCQSVSHSSAAKLTALYLYLTAAVCTARAVWSCALGRVLSYKLVGPVAFVMMALGSSLPYLLTMGGGAAGAENAANWFGNVAAVWDDKADLRLPMAYSGAWAVAAWSVCMPFIFGAFRLFRRPESAVSAGRAET